ncbi:MAG: fasciclin domain-containing protein [Acidobacteria bacterium]|nr:fasciclin domain-containing protein [Acidobacteriota bacterium]
MKHLFASCAVIALMAAPVLAQSTNVPPNDPLSDENVIVDPVDPADVSVDADVESETDVMVTMAPETEAEVEDAATVAAEEEIEAAEAAIEAEEEPMFQAQTTDEAETVAETEIAADAADTDIAQSESAEMTEETEVADAAVEAPIDVAELPAEYSTEDLNALMLAQLNDDAEEIASMDFVAETESFASSETSMESTPETDSYVSTDTVTAPADDYASTESGEMAGTESYAATETDVIPEEDNSTEMRAETEAYAATETAEAPVETYAETETEIVPEEDTAVSTETYASTETEAAPQADTSAMTSDTETYASTETDVIPEEETTVGTESYASTATDMVPDEQMADPQDYAAMEPVDPAMEDEAATVAEEAETMMMAEQSETEGLTAEGDIDQNAVEIAAGDARFSTLVELVGIAGLDDDLAMEGPYTVFAPTNEAFAALPEETLARLKTAEGKPELVEILKAHVVTGAVKADEVPLAGQQAQTLADTSLNLMGSTEGTLNVDGTVHTVGDGIFASNGVVYAVDAVILPETPAE